METDDDDYVENFTTINIETPELKFVMNNCELSGIGNCTTNGTINNLKNSYFDQHYWCPHFSIRSDYEASGQIGNVTVKGSGKSLISYYNYNITLRCYLKSNVTFLNLPYAVTNFSLHLKPEGVMLNFSQLNFSKNDKEADGDSNLKNFEETIREPLMRRLVTPYVSRLQLFPLLSGLFNDNTLLDYILKHSSFA
ncbi:uncharacterized protein LOC113505928 [Trichoplusia ni]|uniref:Uncharacterized protein LOC113505928 n=1 Tax=Trichoplusia ni TaxID=7111 RepID=A0A7E5WWR6_TRINI|nr:uncharacterized protein LOC113505928 [Trichoplusia ni]